MTDTTELTKTERIRSLMRAVCVALADDPDGRPAGEVLAQVKSEYPPRDDELGKYGAGGQKYETNVRFWSIGLVKAGWIVKRKGTWTLTEAGRKALSDFPDPVEFGKEADRLYAQWKKADTAKKKSRAEWELADAVVARIPEGRWVTFSDVSDAVGCAATSLGIHLWKETPPGWHRVARQGGVLTAEAYGDEDRTEEQRGMLLQDGLDSDGVLPADRRLSEAELAGILADVKGGDRAWLVRGTSVRGASIVGEWLAEEYVSLSASMLPTLTIDADDDTIRNAVDSGYSTLGYSQREAKFEEVRAFLRRMRPGDLVLTTSGDDVYVGEVTGAAVQLDSPGKRSNLRRPTDWDNVDSPVPVEDLSSRLKSRLGATTDLVELTDLFDEIQALLSPDEIDGSGGGTPVPTELVLPELSEELIAQLLISRTWLEELVELLASRRQVIIYGPPGTGKTYLAQAVAEALGGKGHVTLVQFHPSYSYEDFFEGYRPAPAKEGGVALQLVPGPFRKVVDLARANPTEPFFLIVDEINRANLAKVFGELYFLLEYRDRTIDLLYSSGDSGGPAFSLPVNVYLIGTMNTADRSIALVDAAMRRRFAFLSLHPEDERLDLVLRAWLIKEGLPEDRAELLVELNKRIGDKDFKIGPSYLMSPAVADEVGLDRIWRTSILPLLEEHHVGDGIDVKAKYGLPALRRAIAGHAGVEVALVAESGDGDTSADEVAE
jgi:5-methylcytosine-specific restriction protein B